MENILYSFRATERFKDALDIMQTRNFNGQNGLWGIKCCGRN